MILKSQMGLNEDDYLQGYSGYMLQFERISSVAVHLYCTI